MTDTPDDETDDEQPAETGALLQPPETLKDRLVRERGDDEDDEDGGDAS